MKFLLKWAFRLFLVLLVLLAVLALSFDTIVTSLAESRLSKQTGLEVRLDKLELRPWSGRARLERLVIHNPADFGGGPLVNVAEVAVEYDPALAKERKLHLSLLRFHLAELHVIVNQEGQSNLDGVRRTVEAVRRGQRVSRTNAPMEFVGLDMLNLTLGKGTWTDLRQSGTPREFDLGIRNEIVRDVKDARELITKLTPILVRAGLSFFGVGAPAPEGGGTNRPPAAPKLNEATVPKRPSSPP
jgi:hypothetical protein